MRSGCWGRRALRPSREMSPETRLTVQPSNCRSVSAATRPDNKEVRQFQGNANGLTPCPKRIFRPIHTGSPLMAAVVRNRFYPFIAVALALFVFIGFSRTYYFRFLTELPPLRTLVHLHGAVFTAWALLFVAQVRLVAAHRVDLHRKLGIASVCVAALVFAVGVATAIGNTAIPRIRPSGLTPAQFSIVSLTSI